MLFRFPKMEKGGMVKSSHHANNIGTISVRKETRQKAMLAIDFGIEAQSTNPAQRMNADFPQKAVLWEREVRMQFSPMCSAWHLHWRVQWHEAF